MFEAQRQWVTRFGKFGDTFRYQYVLSRGEESIDGFAHHRLKTWNLYAGKGLPVCALTDRNGLGIGFLVGIAVGPDSLLTPETCTLPLNSRSPHFWEAFEDYIVEVAGRYAFILECRGKARVYTDPVGMIGAVYSRKDGHVASSPLLAIKRELDPNPAFDLDLIENHGGRLSLFHTADAHVRRLNPNHYLDLDSFTETRFWPRDEDFLAAPQEPGDLYAEIIARAGFNIGAIAGRHACSMPISGGQDSRLVLAFAQGHEDKISQFYTHINNYATRRDATIGSELCKVLGVDHETHDKRDHTISPRTARRTVWAYQLACGAKQQPPKEYLNGVVDSVPEGNVILRGHQTDLLRAVFVFEPKEKWHETDWQIERLLIVPRKKFNADIAEKYREDFVTWQATLPDNAREKAADFMFLEVYYNSSIGASFPALWKNFYMSPFNSRRLIGLALLFDEDTRRKSLPVFDLIETINPGLSDIPFDFEWPPSLDLVGDRDMYAEVAKSRLRKTRRRLKRYARNRAGLSAE